jgi:hypothetical protein
MGPRTGLDVVVRGENCCSYRGSNSFQPVASRYTDCAVPAPYLYLYRAQNFKTGQCTILLETFKFLLIRAWKPEIFNHVNASSQCYGTSMGAECRCDIGRATRSAYIELKLT